MDIYAEIGQLLAGEKLLRESNDEITILIRSVWESKTMLHR
jgi:hypothetical protein